MQRIPMTTPLVEMDGDEMTRILWQMIKDKLILPHVDLKVEYYDLGLLSRNATDDQITVDAANATKKYGVAVKCATITPNAQRMEEYPQLKKMWASPNGTIRSILDGTVFRVPITIDKIKPVVKNWEAPITIARHAYGDVYKGVEMVVNGSGTACLVFEGKDGETQRHVICETSESTADMADMTDMTDMADMTDMTGMADMTGLGSVILQGVHNTERSIRSFAKSCFQYALDTKQDLWFSTKDTISKVYDGFFKEVFENEYNAHYKEQMDALGLEYFYTLIDDAVARVMRSKGGFVWACKNYDGDVMSDMISTAFGSLAMMTSVLVSPDGPVEYEAAHGTVTRHYYRHLKGEKTSTNPIATIFAWSGALRKRGELDGIGDLTVYGDALEAASLETLNAGIMTQDLVGLVEDGSSPRSVTSEEFLDEIARRLAEKLR
ncbi:MAG: isocitrate dehydrogenase (NADP(+)) [Peptococcaceae bacterium]|nr:isocitrate dehydrogenase (NADP(+)) [Peptococcaceae bacterium]